MRVGRLLDDPDAAPAGWQERPLERLLQPLGVSTFLDQIWEREPCVISGRSPSYYSDIVTIADVDAIVSMLDPSAPDPFVLLARYGETGQQYKAIPRTSQGTPDLRFIYQAYDEGYSIKVCGLQRRWEPISRFCAALQQELRHPVGVYLFLTPPGGQAVLPHYDAHDVLILQIEGTKHWKIYPQAMAFPVQDMEQPVSRELLGEPIREVDLSQPVERNKMPIQRHAQDLRIALPQWLDGVLEARLGDDEFQQFLKMPLHGRQRLIGIERSGRNRLSQPNLALDHACHRVSQQFCPAHHEYCQCQMQ
ncbi:hypothetical protein CCP4SC76_8080002 [Gammaproteobacteria bacterium]